MTLSVQRNSGFKKDVKRMKKQGRNLAKLAEIIAILMAEDELPVKNRNHRLTGSLAGKMECHIEPDWLLIYEIAKERNTLFLVRTGSHSDLF